MRDENTERKRAAEVAEALTTLTRRPWTYEPHLEYGARIVGTLAPTAEEPDPIDVRICVSQQYGSVPAGMTGFRVALDDHAQHNAWVQGSRAKTPACNCSNDRPLEAVANDVWRKVIAEARPFLRDIEAARVADLERHTTALAVARRFEAIGLSFYGMNGRDPEDTALSTYQLTGRGFDVEVHHAGAEVSLKAGWCNVDRAVGIVANFPKEPTE